MCNIQQNSVAGLGLLAADAIVNSLSQNEDTGALDYAQSLAGIQQAEAASRLAASQSINASARSREAALRQSAQNLGEQRAAHGASGLSLDSGSRLALAADAAAEAQRGAEGYSAEMREEAEAQRLAEEGYAQKKSLLYAQYRAAAKNTRKNSLLTGYNQWRSNLLGFDSLMGNLAG